MRHHNLDEQGGLIRWLRSRYGNKSIRAITKAIADEFLFQTSQSHPPVNLFAISKARRIKYRTASQLTTDGRMSVNNEGFQIDLKEGFETRKRFTLAHEIAHTIFYDLSATPPQRLLHGAKTKDEEAFCNILASDILMPSELIGRELNKLNPSGENIPPITLLRRLASLFKVSLEAMTRRVIEDVQLLNGVVLGMRWLPGLIKSPDIKPSDPAWRLRWWAANPAIMEPLYLPAVSRHPKLELDIIEQAFNAGEPQKFHLDINKIKLGNLKKILNQALSGINTVDVWVHPIKSKGLQLDAITDGSTSPHDYNNFTLFPSGDEEDISKLARERSEVVMFFSLEQTLPNSSISKQGVRFSNLTATTDID